MTTNGRPRTTVMRKLTGALIRGKGVSLPLRDVHALVDITEPLTTDQYAQLHDLASSWERTGRNCSSFAVQKAYDTTAEQLKHWIQTQQGAGE